MLQLVSITGLLWLIIIPIDNVTQRLHNITVFMDWFTLLETVIT